MSAQPNSTPFTLPAGQTTSLTVTGNFFRLLASTGAVQIRTPGGTFRPFRIGTGQTEPSEFTALEVMNPDPANAISGLIETADSETTTAESLNQDASTINTNEVYFWGAQSPIGTTISLPGSFVAAGGAYKGAIFRRKRLIITPDVAVDMKVVLPNSLAALGGAIIPATVPVTVTQTPIYVAHGGANVELDTDEFLTMFNVNIGAPNIEIYQQWYLHS